MSDNHYAPARVADYAGRAQVIGARFTTDYNVVPGVANAWSAYAAGFTTVGEWVVLGVYAQIFGTAIASTALHIQTQLATGAGGAEVPFATIGDAFAFLSPASTGSYMGFCRTFLIPPTYMPNGTVIRQKSSVNIAAANGRIRWNLFGVPAPFYQRKHPLHRPDMYMRGRTALGSSQIQSDFMILPTPLSQAAVTTAAAAFGNWVTVITAANQTSPLLIVGVKCVEHAPGEFINQAILAQLGIGEAAAAIGIEEVKFCNASPGLPGGYVQLRRPIFLPASSGLSIQAGSVPAKQVDFQVMAVPLK